MAGCSRTFALIVALVLATTLITVPPVQAAPVWQLVTDLSADGQSASGVQVAVSPTGTSIALWRRHGETSDEVQASIHPPGGPWSAPVDLSASVDLANVSDPAIALDAAGNATAIWTLYGRNGGYSGYIQTATRPVDGNWSDAKSIAFTAEGHFAPLVSVNPAGDASGMWISKLDGEYFVRAATRHSGGGWSGETDLVVAPDYYPLGTFPPKLGGLVTDSAGNNTAIWTLYNGIRYVVQAAARPADGAWSTAVDISAPGQSAGDPRIALDPDGDVTAVWTGSSQTGTSVYSSSLPLGGTWSAPVPISAGAQNSGYPDIDIDSAGNTTAVWSSAGAVLAATRPPGGTWSEATDVSTTGLGAHAPEIALGPSGSATAVWVDYNGAYYNVQAATRRGDGSWSALTDLSAGEAWDPHVAVDRAGNATVVWTRLYGTHSVVQARGLDVTGPVVAALASPATGEVGQSIGWSVTAVDTWSAVASTVWDFGDGSSATGSSVTHSYGAAGTYDVSVTITDAVGNATVRIGSIIVAAAPPIPPAATPPTVATAAITSFTLRPARIRAVGSDSTAKRKTKAGIVLTAAARVTLTFKRKGSRKPDAKLVKALVAGKNTFKLTAKLGKRKLEPGRYVVKASTGTSTNKAELKIIR